ncbi:MAG: ABC transporter permease [Pseudomonadota bacterium]
MGSILGLIARRLGLGLVTLFVVSIIIFAAIEALPGNFAQEILGQGATPEAIAAIERDLGLDKSPVERYFGWLGGVLVGDFGIPFSQLSFAGNFGTADRDVITVADQIRPRFGNTLFLAGFAAIIAVPLSLLIGVLAALYRGSIFDRFANVFTLTSISSPEFFVAYILILFLAVTNQWFPSISNINPDMSVMDRAYASVLPALTLTLVVTAHMMRMTRAAIINLLASPYIEMARLKGLKPFRVIVKHALPNALAPIINVIALNLAYLVTGVVVVEVVFVYPGIGQLFVDSVKLRDMPVVQACCLIFAAAYILLNLTADVMSILTNPRLRHPK